MDKDNLIKQLSDAVKTGAHYNFITLRSATSLRPGEYALLSYIWDHKDREGGVKISDISRFMRVTPPTVTPIVGRMEKQGYINRVTSKQDRRVANLFLTPKGKEALDECNEKRSEQFSNLIEILGEDDTKELIRILKKMSPKDFI